ncbi:unnamed protein product [Paramecium pentaurelia]|uniref:Uncharacterized protein n=1 Tax=Paramecium pentaurelia TaxID=43138 RepID=A0A8S1RVZ3_9CILI|nr:unnamed protein product [Paramecium pentaurelia]
MGYPLKVGADYSYSYGFTESSIQTSGEIGISENIYATLSVRAFGELNIIYIIKIRAGVQGYIFTGDVNGVAQFQINNIDKVVISNKYNIFRFLSRSINIQHIGRRWWKICFRYPKITFSNWKDVYKKRQNIAKLQAKKRIFELKSKCY